MAMFTFHECDADSPGQSNQVELAAGETSTTKPSAESVRWAPRSALTRLLDRGIQGDRVVEPLIYNSCTKSPCEARCGLDAVTGLLHAHSRRWN